MERRKLTLMDIQAMKEQGRKLTMLSICDYPMALIAEKAGIDMILVGDSLGMTALGYENTVPVTLELRLSLEPQKTASLLEICRSCHTSHLKGMQLSMRADL